jgi:uncharacterized radical SAM superfamily Fe-S cluster-containing enzyme
MRAKQKLRASDLIVLIESQVNNQVRPRSWENYCFATRYLSRNR